MDGDSKADVPEKNLRKVVNRQMKGPMIGKQFFNDGPTDNITSGPSRIKPGEFQVLCRQGSGYWCERLNNLDGERDIQYFQVIYMKNVIKSTTE